MIKHSPSKQLVDHAISVVLERRYRRALKPIMPENQKVITHSLKRETGRGRTKMKKNLEKHDSVKRTQHGIQTGMEKEKPKKAA